MKRALQFAVGLVVTIALVWLLLDRIDTAQLLEAIGRTTAIPLLVGLVLLTLDFGVRLLRWWWMLRLQGADLRPASCVTPFFASIALNNLLPFRLGDAARAFAFRRQLGVGGGRLVGTLVVERLLDLLTLLTLFVLGIIGANDGALPAGVARIAALVAGSGLATLLLFMTFSRRIQARLPQWLHRLPGRRFAWIEYQCNEFLAVLVVLHTPRAIVQLVGLSFAAWILEAGVFVAAASATASGASGAGSLFAMTTGTLATLLPSTPGYVGTFDYFATAGWTAYGLRPELAAANAVVAHLLLWLPLTILGLALLALPTGRALRERALRLHAGAAAPPAGHDP